MKVISISKNTLQDKNNPKQFYEYNKEYEVDDKTGKRLIESGKFELVETDNDVVLDYSNGEPPKVIVGEEVTKKTGKKSTK